MWRAKQTNRGGSDLRGSEARGVMRVKPYESHLKIDTATDPLANLDVKETDVCVRKCQMKPSPKHCGEIDTLYYIR